MSYLCSRLRADIESIWRECWLARAATALTFREQLQAYWLNKRKLNAGGSLSSLSRSASSHGYATPSTSTRTTVDDERDALCALKLYERLAADLATSDEDQIYQAGINSLANESASEAIYDFTGALAYV